MDKPLLFNKLPMSLRLSPEREELRARIRVQLVAAPVAGARRAHEQIVPLHPPLAPDCGGFRAEPVSQLLDLCICLPGRELLARGTEPKLSTLNRWRRALGLAGVASIDPN